jgi:hypothetical protein
MTDLVPRYVARAVLADQGSGALVFTGVPATGVAAALTPFYKGDKGDKGDTGNTGATGATGPAANGSGDVFLNAAAALSGHLVVVTNANGDVAAADPTIAAHGFAVLGITRGAASSGAQATVATSGTIDHSGWTWTPNEPVFLGASGSLTQTPFSGAVFLKVMGLALSATRISVNLQPTLWLS